MNRVQLKFIEDAMEQESKLSEWEAKFLDDLASKEEDYKLSEKQNEVLNRIQRKVT